MYSVFPSLQAHAINDYYRPPYNPYYGGGYYNYYNRPVLQHVKVPGSKACIQTEICPPGERFNSDPRLCQCEPIQAPIFPPEPFPPSRRPSTRCHSPSRHPSARINARRPRC